MKKILAIVLTLALALTLCACTSTPSTDSTDTPSGSSSGDTPGGISESGSESVEPSVTSPGDSSDTALESNAESVEISGDLIVWLNNETYAKAIIEAFNDRYPNVSVQFEQFGGLGATEKLALDGPSGIGADVIECPHDTAALAIADGHLEPFPSDVQARLGVSVNEAAINAFKHDERLYGAPISLQNIALFYNKDLYPGPPESFEEIIEFAKTYNDPAGRKHALRFLPTYYSCYFFLTAFGHEIFGPDGDDWKNPGFDSSGMTKGLNFIKSLREVYNVNHADITNDAVDGAFNRGEIPFVINGPWAIAAVQESGVNFGVTKLPTIGGVQPICFSGANAASVSSYSENFDAAFAFAEFMASEKGAQILYETMGILAALKDISGVPGLSDDESLRGFSDQAPYTAIIPTIPEVNLTWNPANTMLQLVWDDQLTVEDAQKKAMEEYELMLNGSGQSMYD